MTHDYVKKEIPSEISTQGGASVHLVNKRTVPLNDSIREALAGNYVMGTENLVRSNFVGLMKSMAEGVQRDGHARQLGDLITMYPCPKGTFDLDKGWDPLVNSMALNVRLLNDLEIDISKWAFRDVTPGKQSFGLDSVSTGDLIGVVKTDANVHLNGRDLPPKATMRISWVCGTKSGTVAAEKFSGDATRIDIDKTAFSALGAAEDGLDIEFTLRACYTTAKKSAKVQYVAPPPTTPSVTNMTDQEGTVCTEWHAKTTDFNGVNLPSGGSTESGSSVKIKFTNLDSVETTRDFTNQLYNVDTSGTKFRLPASVPTSIMGEIGENRTCTFTITRGGQTGTFVAQLALE